MKILDAKSLEILRIISQQDRGILDLSYEEMVEKHDLSEMDVNYNINPCDAKLIPPLDNESKQQSDYKNSLELIAKLNNLTPAQATDERLWVTLAFKHYRKYCIQRQPHHSKSGSDYQRHLELYWFPKSRVYRVRHCLISRLWWQGYLVRRIKRWEISETLKLLIFHSDIKRALLNRPSIFNSATLFESILILVHDTQSQHSMFPSKAFEEFIKKVTFLSKRSYLPSFSTDELIKYLRPHLDKIIKESL